MNAQSPRRAMWRPTQPAPRLGAQPDRRFVGGVELQIYPHATAADLAAAGRALLRLADAMPPATPTRTPRR